MNNKSKLINSLTIFGLSALMAVALGGCAQGIQTEAKYPTGYERPSTGGDIYAKPQSILGAGGLGIGGDRSKEEDAQTGIGVNTFLWRAALDTVSFMPLASADPFGGTILTDWYTPDESKGERYKLNVFILTRELRSDGIQVRVFKQISQNGSWFDAAPDKDMGRKLEDTILTRARQMRVARLDK
jgi:hypothetical protein